MADLLAKAEAPVLAVDLPLPLLLPVELCLYPPHLSLLNLLCQLAMHGLCNHDHLLNCDRCLQSFQERQDVENRYERTKTPSANDCSCAVADDQGDSSWRTQFVEGALHGDICIEPNSGKA